MKIKFLLCSFILAIGSYAYTSESAEKEREISLYIQKAKSYRGAVTGLRAAGIELNTKDETFLFLNELHKRFPYVGKKVLVKLLSNNKFAQEWLQIEPEKPVVEQKIIGQTPEEKITSLVLQSLNIGTALNLFKELGYDKNQELIKIFFNKLNEKFPEQEVRIARSIKSDASREWLKQIKPDVIYDYIPRSGYEELMELYEQAYGDYSKIEKWLSRGFDPNIIMQESLSLVDPELLKLAVYYGADINRIAYPVPGVVAMYGHVSSPLSRLRLINKQVSDPERGGTDPNFLARLQKMIRFLEQEGAIAKSTRTEEIIPFFTLTPKTVTALEKYDIITIDEDRDNRLREYLKAGNDVNALFFIALQRDDLALFDFALKNGAHINLSVMNDEESSLPSSITPLTYLLQKKFFYENEPEKYNATQQAIANINEMIRQLQEKGGTITPLRRNPNYITSLYYADYQLYE